MSSPAVLMNPQPKGLMKRAPLAKTVPCPDPGRPAPVPRHSRVGLYGDATPEVDWAQVVQKKKKRRKQEAVRGAMKGAEFGKTKQFRQKMLVAFLH